MSGSQYAHITSHYTDPLTPLLQVLLSLSTDIIKDSYQHLGGNMGELPDLKKRTVAEAIVRKWGERICVIVKYRPCRGSVSIASIELGVSYEP